MKTDMSSFFEHIFPSFFSHCFYPLPVRPAKMNLNAMKLFTPPIPYNTWIH